MTSRGHELLIGPDESSKALGIAIRKLREIRHLSREELANAAGIGFEMISKVELGARKPSQETFRLICFALGVTEERVRLDGQDIQRYLQHKDEIERSTEMVTGYEQGMYNDIHQIAQHLKGIDDSLKGFLKMAREEEVAEHCTMEGCENETLLRVQGEGWCQDHINEAFTKAATAISDAMASMEEAMDREASDRVRRGRD